MKQSVRILLVIFGVCVFVSVFFSIATNTIVPISIIKPAFEDSIFNGIAIIVFIILVIIMVYCIGKILLNM